MIAKLPLHSCQSKLTSGDSRAGTEIHSPDGRFFLKEQFLVIYFTNLVLLDKKN